MMKAGRMFAAIVLVSSLSLWGCSSQKTGTFTAKIKELEDRHAKLESQQRTLVSQNQESRRKIEKLEGDLGAQREELQTLRIERDDLRKQIGARTVERDNLHTQLGQLAKDLQSMVGRVEAAMSTVPGPAIAEGSSPAVAPVTAQPTSRVNE
ncbi:MAG: hypothetical protein K2X38_18495 [Gemmataceae bacterium]|nr:hypothetical protein [Gemmataceae bacterium]